MRFKAKIFFLITALAITVGSISEGAQQTASQDSGHNILILNSYHKEFQWTDHQVVGAALRVGPREGHAAAEDALDVRRVVVPAHLDDHLFLAPVDEQATVSDDSQIAGA